jgi:hypothetical protein
VQLASNPKQWRTTVLTLQKHLVKVHVIFADQLFCRLMIMPFILVLTGIARGLAGVVILPVAGVGYGVMQIGQGIVNTPESVSCNTHSAHS